MHPDMRESEVTSPTADGQGCTCPETESHYAATWHDEDCPRYQNQCTRCEGYGYVLVRLGREDCDWCDGTGNAPPTGGDTP